jgi:hypothetical protein
MSAKINEGAGSRGLEVHSVVRFKVGGGGGRGTEQNDVTRPLSSVFIAYRTLLRGIMKSSGELHTAGVLGWGLRRRAVNV